MRAGRHQHVRRSRERILAVRVPAVMQTTPARRVVGLAPVAMAATVRPQTGAKLTAARVVSAHTLAARAAATTAAGQPTVRNRAAADAAPTHTARAKAQALPVR